MRESIDSKMLFFYHLTVNDPGTTVLDLVLSLSQGSTRILELDGKSHCLISDR